SLTVSAYVYGDTLPIPHANLKLDNRDAYTISVKADDDSVPVTLLDYYSNKDASAIDTVQIEMSSSFQPLEVITLFEIQETGPDTSFFSGYLPTLKDLGLVNGPGDAWLGFPAGEESVNFKLKRHLFYRSLPSLEFDKASYTMSDSVTITARCLDMKSKSSIPMTVDYPHPQYVDQITRSGFLGYSTEDNSGIFTHTWERAGDLTNEKTGSIEVLLNSLNCIVKYPDTQRTTFSATAEVVNDAKEKSFPWGLK
ncbi:unnamed protein product, partial [marine sediment metagenome]